MSVTAPPVECDVLIAGGGLAGLLLAAGLCHERFAALRVCVVEPRLRYVRDRTWSYWRQGPHDLSHLERRTWQHWSVAYAGHEIQRAAPGWVYASVDADEVYANALNKIHAVSHVQLLQGWGVDGDLSAEVTLKNVHSGQGCRIGACRVVDARARLQLQPSDLVQQFVGLEVCSDQAVFEPEMVQLMHFESAKQGLHFMYVLPYDAHRALIETTWISPASHQPDFEEELRQAVELRLGNASYEVVYREQGCLPLITPAQPRDGVIRLGRSGAALRPSTGYAFLNTLAQVQHVLAQWPSESKCLANWQAPMPPNTVSQRWMDAVFLRELQSHWQRAPERFMDLFASVSPDVLIRFLSGHESWVDRIAVMRALPISPFIQAAWHHSKRTPMQFKAEHG
jgi:lycopene beta-cyclase